MGILSKVSQAVGKAAGKVFPQNIIAKAMGTAPKAKISPATIASGLLPLGGGIFPVARKVAGSGVLNVVKGAIAKKSVYPASKVAAVKAATSKMPVKPSFLKGTPKLPITKTVGQGGIIKTTTRPSIQSQVGGLISAYNKQPLAKKITLAAAGISAAVGTVAAVEKIAEFAGVNKGQGFFGVKKSARRKSKRRKRKSARRARRPRRKSSAPRGQKRVSFTTRDGRRVSFIPRGKRRTSKRRVRRSRRSWLADRARVSKEPWEQRYQRLKRR